MLNMWNMCRGRTDGVGDVDYYHCYLGVGARPRVVRDGEELSDQRRDDGAVRHDNHRLPCVLFPDSFEPRQGSGYELLPRLTALYLEAAVVALVVHLELVGVDCLDLLTGLALEDAKPPLPHQFVDLDRGRGDPKAAAEHLCAPLRPQEIG